MGTQKGTSANLWLILGALCVGFNAVLMQQRRYSQEVLQQLQAQLEEAEQNLARREQSADLYDFPKRSMKEIMTMGQVFFDYRTHYEGLDDVLREHLHEEHNDTVSEQLEYLTDLGYKMLSVPVSREEKATGQLYSSTVQAMTSRLKEAGVVVIPSLHGPERCRKLAHNVHADIRDPWVEYGNIKRNEYRKDLPLQLDGEYLDVLQETLRLLQPVYADTLREGPVLKEFSSLTSYPGSGEQVFHFDTKANSIEDLQRDGLLYSAFIYLDDVGEFTAPFDAYPGSHGHLNLVQALRDDIREAGPFVRMAVPQGSMVIYNSRLLHRGSANTSPLTRPTIYFSLQESERASPYGSSYSLHPHYMAKDITLENIVARDVSHSFFPLTTSHNDLLCEVSMKKACPGRYEDPEDFLECAEDYFDDNELRGCAFFSRMEKIAGARIFQEDFEAEVTWGNL